MLTDTADTAAVHVMSCYVMFKSAQRASLSAAAAPQQQQRSPVTFNRTRSRYANLSTQSMCSPKKTGSNACIRSSQIGCVATIAPQVSSSSVLVITCSRVSPSPHNARFFCEKLAFRRFYGFNPVCQDVMCMLAIYSR